MAQRTRVTLALTALAVALLVGGVGCSKNKFIPNTRVTDTPLNREVLRVVERYRRAMSGLNAAEVLALVHPTYQDNSGTPEGSDDIDYEGLKTLLNTRFKNTSKVRFRIEYQDVTTRGREALVDTYIDATFVYNSPEANPRWRRLTDFNRFRLIKEKGTWRFVSGL